MVVATVAWHVAVAGYCTKMCVPAAIIVPWWLLQAPCQATDGSPDVSLTALADNGFGVLMGWQRVLRRRRWAMTHVWGM